MVNYPANDQLKDVLRCPVTKGKLRALRPDELKILNDRISRRDLIHNDGTPIETTMEAGFISSDGQFAYMVLEDVLILLKNLAIPLAATAKENMAPVALGAEKKILQDFYDQVGWHKNGSGEANTFVDALKWEDLRSVAQEYIHNCHLRVNRYIKPNGCYLLDAGSGPVQYQDYLTYSEGYQYRICLDLSFLALREAKSKLGSKGIYILGDITNIPLQDNSVDGAVSLHVVYHVPKDEQINAINEIYRVLKPECSAAIIYSWPNSSFMSFFLFHRKVRKTLRTWIQELKKMVKTILRLKRQQPASSKATAPETPYHYTFNPDYFASRLKGIKLQILVWRSVSVPFMRMYIHPRLFGELIMKWIYNQEEKNPALFGRIGQYPLFVISKEQLNLKEKNS